ncbi:hypothetical protein GCM10022247_00530 [Allokutzneria multivorans]|uniref:Uncharacterized protein n=1 Tax=Allokutzneria multivorans TaxID=1142134 RepID=A0ABP7QR28_9PSEU
MLRFGFALTLLGFGSMALSQYSDRQFAILMWAEPMQPALGIGVGVLGLVLLVLGFAQKSRKPAAPAQPSLRDYSPQQHQGQPYPQQPQGQPYPQNQQRP